MKKTIKIILIILLISIIIENILFPAYLSTTYACFPSESNQEYEILGKTTYNMANETITIKFNNIMTLKHEYIHYKQFLRNKDTFISCGIFGTTRYLIELEAYTGQYLPDFIYKPIYGDYSKFIK